MQVAIATATGASYRRSRHFAATQNSVAFGADVDSPYNRRPCGPVAANLPPGSSHHLKYDAAALRQ
jgi:hypothetical protein